MDFIKRFLAKLYVLSRQISSLQIIPIALKTKAILKKYIQEEKGKVSVVVLTEHIGDIIACEPVSYWLKKTYNHKIVWVVNKKYNSIPLMFKSVDKVIDVSCLSEWIYIDKITKFKNVYNLHFNGRQCPQFFLKNKGARKDIQFENYYNYGCLLESFCQIGGLPKLNIQPKLVLAKQELSFRYQLPDKFIAIQTQANDVNREWSKEKWNELLAFFPDNVFLEIGTISNLSGKNCITSLCGNLTFNDIAIIIKKCFLFIGIDSSIAHFSNALQKPSLLLLGKFHQFKKYMPYSGISKNENFRVIQYPETVYNLPTSLVLEQLNCLISNLNEN